MQQRYTDEHKWDRTCVFEMNIPHPSLLFFAYCYCDLLKYCSQKPWKSKKTFACVPECMFIFHIHTQIFTWNTVSHGHGRHEEKWEQGSYQRYASELHPNNLNINCLGSCNNLKLGLEFRKRAKIIL